MPRKRIKSKKIDKVNLNILDNLLYESICKKKSMEELFREDEHKRSGIDDGLNGWSFDKNDPKVCAHVWNLHGKAVMEKWKLHKWNVGTRPYLWWKVEAPEPRIKVKRIYKYFKYPDGRINYTEAGDLEIEKLEEETEREYLIRLNLIEDWEKKD